MSEERLPILAKWVVRYDTHKFPEFIQGTYFPTGGTADPRFGQKIQVNGIEFLDLKDKICRTSDNKEYKLVGEGQQMVLLSNSDIDMLFGELEGEFPEDLN